MWLLLIVLVFVEIYIFMSFRNLFFFFNDKDIL